MNFSKRGCSNLKNEMLVVKSILYAAYFVFVAYLVFIGGNDYRHLDMFSFGRVINLIPFQDKAEFMVSGGYTDLRDFYYFVREIIGNALLFFPMPIIFFLEGMRSAWKAILIAFLSSLGIEIIQLISNLGQADVDDLILNTLGAVLGIGFFKLVQRHKKWEDIRTFFKLPVYEIPVLTKVASPVRD